MRDISNVTEQDGIRFMLRFLPKLFLSSKSRVKIEERIFVGKIIGKMFA